MIEIPSKPCSVTIFHKILEDFLDFRLIPRDLRPSMPAEPLGFFGNLMLNSGGFFFARIRRWEGAAP